MSQQATRPEQPRSRTASGSSGRRPSGQRPSGQGPGGRGKRPTAPKPEPKHPLWVRWLALVLFVAVLGVAFVNLGEWQLRRLHERRVDNVVIRTNEAAPVADFDQLFSQPITEQQEWRRVRVTGTFDAGRQYVIRYRDNGDDSGYEVVTPLRTSRRKLVSTPASMIDPRLAAIITSTRENPRSGF